MATRRKRKEPTERNEKREAEKKLLERIHDRWKVMKEADEQNRNAAMDDLRFVTIPGEQWDPNMKKERGDRPCLEFNRLRVTGKRVINEIRANRPQGKVRAVEGGDKEGAELREGLVRNIANISDFETITDQAAEYVVDAGIGAWRIVTEYASEDVFDQDILIKGIKDPFNLYCDPAAQDPLKRDAEDWILTERISNSTYEKKYGEAAKSDFEASEFDDYEDWADDETVRIAEYWWKEPAEKEIWLIQRMKPDGTPETITVDSTSDEARLLAEQGVKPVKRRMCQTHKIMMCIASGDAILEGPTEQAGSQHRFVLLHGEMKVVDGKTIWHGLHRFAKDAQRSYNINRTAADEHVATATKAHDWATPKQAEGHMKAWSEAHKKNFPFKLYNPDPMAPGAPVRIPGPDVPVALIQQTAIAAQDIRDVEGLHEASFGEESGEKSGIALQRKQAQAQIVTYNYPDNIAKGVRRTWEIILDLIPHIYDADRELRIIGADGAEDYKRINAIVQDEKTGQAIRVNDMTSGKYDVTVTTGPSFSTQRQEAAQVWSEISARDPRLLGVAGDLIVKSFDLPYSEEIGQRFQTLLPPQIQQQLSEGKKVPPEVQAVMAQAQQAMQLVQQQSQLVQQAAAEVETNKADAEKARANVEKAIADLKAERAEFEAVIAKQMAALQTREAQLIAKEAGVTIQENQASQSTSEIAARASQEIAAAASSVMQAAEAALAQIRTERAMPMMMPNRPRIRAIHARRENGELLAIPEYEPERMQ